MRNKYFIKKCLLLIILFNKNALNAQLSTYGNTGIGYTFHAKNVLDISILSRVNFLTFNEDKSSVGLAFNPSVLGGFGNTNDPKLTEKFISIGYSLPIALEFHSGRHNCKKLDENNEDIKFGYFGGLGYAFSSITTLTNDRTAQNNTVKNSYPVSGPYLNGGIWYNHIGLRLSYIHSFTSINPSVSSLALIFKLTKPNPNEKTYFHRM